VDVVDFYTGSWIGDDREGVRKVLAPDVDVDWNLDAPVDEEELVQTLHRVAVFADTVTVVSRVRGADGAALVYDLAAPFGTARLAEFLTVAAGRITEVRQVYDIVAIDRYFPGLYDQ
jgi:ketosteroid isomerase-like protein